MMKRPAKDCMVAVLLFVSVSVYALAFYRWVMLPLLTPQETGPYFELLLEALNGDEAMVRLAYFTLEHLLVHF